MPENLSLSQPKLNTMVNLDSKESPIMRLKQPPMGNYSLHSTPSNSPLLSQRHPATGVPIIGHKDLMHKDMMHKALNVPPTPSPDSAIHSAYSVFSSPNQSPLTQRHITLTPNLSRNNSDASHSSCCSYSSVSVSVSPTQQFSPTHSPIQVSVLKIVLYFFFLVSCNDLIIADTSRSIASLTPGMSLCVLINLLFGPRRLCNARLRCDSALQKCCHYQFDIHLKVAN